MAAFVQADAARRKQADHGRQLRHSPNKPRFSPMNRMPDQKKDDSHFEGACHPARAVPQNAGEKAALAFSIKRADRIIERDELRLLLLQPRVSSEVVQPAS